MMKKGLMRDKSECCSLTPSLNAAVDVKNKVNWCKIQSCFSLTHHWNLKKIFFRSVGCFACEMLVTVIYMYTVQLAILYYICKLTGVQNISIHHTSSYHQTSPNLYHYCDFWTFFKDICNSLFVWVTEWMPVKIWKFYHFISHFNIHAAISAFKHFKKLEAGHSIECITHAGLAALSRRVQHSAKRWRHTVVSSQLFALFDPVTLSFDLLTKY